MLEWLKQFGTARLKNPAGLSDKALEHLAKDFQSLEKLEKSLPTRVVRFIVDGDDVAVLGELSDMTNAINIYILLSAPESVYFGKNRMPARSDFFRQAQPTNYEVYFRLADVYLAIANRSPIRQFYPQHLWLQVLLTESYVSMGLACRSIPEDGKPTAIDIEHMLCLRNESPADLLKMICHADINQEGIEYYLEHIAGIRGFAQSALRYPEEMKAALRGRNAKQLLHVLSLFPLHDIPVEPFLPELVALFFSPTKQVHEAVSPLLPPATTLPLLEPYLCDGKSREKILVVQWLSRYAGDAAAPLLTRQLACETSDTVLQEINAVLRYQERKQADTLRHIELPPLPPVDLKVPLPAEIHRQLLNFFESYNKDIRRVQEKNAASHIDHSKFNSVEIPLKKIDSIFSLLQGEHRGEESVNIYEEAKIVTYFMLESSLRKMLKAMVEHPKMHPIHFVRLSLLFDRLRITVDATQLNISDRLAMSELLNSYNNTHNVKIGLRELAHLLGALNIDGSALGWARLVRTPYHQQFVIDDELTWPFYFEHLDQLRQALGLETMKGPVADSYLTDIRREAFIILRAFPLLPAELTPFLWDVALGTSKTERPLAMACLEKAPGNGQVLIDALGNSKQDTRLAAAEWLGKFQVTEAIPALRSALKKENSEVAKATMMNALRCLGVSLQEMVDRAGLAKEAQHGLQKGLPPALSWFPIDNMPTVHWADTAEQLDPRIITWWMAVAIKVGSPEPNALLQCYRELLAPKEREALARYILEAWLSYDTLRKYTQQEAAAQAKNFTAQMKQYVQKNPKYFTDWSEEQHYRTTLNALLDTCKGSAIKEKGCLALVGAFGGDDIPAVTHRYIKYWYGNRLHQCKALVRMLHWIDRGTAIQLLLQLATRFRTKGIQQEAELCVNALAERKKWTLDELADRTIPTAGFDDGPEMTLDFGARAFIARLNDEGIITLFDESGKAIKTLPDARKDDDAEKVKEVKKALTTAKKEVKNIVVMQRSRLYEAMCTQRLWRFADWQACLHQHPIMRLLCQRVVWQLDGQPACTFRPLNDGTLSDATDNDVTPEATQIVSVAHSCTVSSQQQQDWPGHFKDYEVTPLFDQFNRPLYTLPDKMKEQSEINEFEGHMLEAFKLRGKANNFGYTRGQSEDGGWFYTYEKRFAGLKIIAVIEFSGNGLPEENRMVALKTLSFRELTENNEYSYNAQHLSLRRIPSVLLTECWNDLRLLAGEGIGFDADWEKKAYN